MSKTTSFQRLGTAGLAALAMVGLLSGCSSKKTTGSTAGSASTAAVAAAATSGGAAPAASPTASLPSPSKVVATGGGKFCQQVASAVKNEVADEAASGTGPASMKALVQQQEALEATVLKEAPSAIKPDLTVLFDAVNQLYAELASVNYDFTKLSPTAAAGFDTPAVKAAEQNVDAYAKNTCGVDVGPADTAPSAQAQASAAEASALAMLSAAAA